MVTECTPVSPVWRGVSAKADDVCRDIGARGSKCPEVLYLDPSLSLMNLMTQDDQYRDAVPWYLLIPLILRQLRGLVGTIATWATGLHRSTCTSHSVTTSKQMLLGNTMLLNDANPHGEARSEGDARAALLVVCRLAQCGKPHERYEDDTTVTTICPPLCGSS